MVLLLSIKARFRQQYIERTTTILEKELQEQDSKRMLHCLAINNQCENEIISMSRGWDKEKNNLSPGQNSKE